MPMNQRLLRPMASAASTPSGTQASLLLHFDGANGSTTFTDSSPTANAISPINGAHISTGRSKFGGSSALFSVDDESYLEWTHNGALNFTATEDFTIEAWMYTEASTAYSPLIDARNANQFGFFACGIMHDAQEGSKLDFLYQEDRLTTYQEVPVNEWVHVAWVRRSGTLYAFINGVQDANTKSMTGARSAVQEVARIGGVYDPIFMDGSIDELRIIKGTAIYQENFTPPTAPLSAYV